MNTLKKDREILKFSSDRLKWSFSAREWILNFFQLFHERPENQILLGSFIVGPNEWLLAIGWQPSLCETPYRNSVVSMYNMLWSDAFNTEIHPHKTVTPPRSHLGESDFCRMGWPTTSPRHAHAVRLWKPRHLITWSLIKERISLNFDPPKNG